MRFRQFLIDGYSDFLEDWRPDYGKPHARERWAKVVTVEDRGKEAAKLAQKGFISRAASLISSTGIAPCTMAAIQQMLEKHPQTPGHS